MTIKQFIEEAKAIGCKDQHISAVAEGNYHTFDKATVFVYRIWCAGCRKHTQDYSNPLDALDEFRIKHNKKLRVSAEEMVLTEETHEN